MAIGRSLRGSEYFDDVFRKNKQKKTWSCVGSIGLAIQTQSQNQAALPVLTKQEKQVFYSRTRDLVLLHSQVHVHTLNALFCSWLSIQLVRTCIRL